MSGDLRPPPPPGGSVGPPGPPPGVDPYRIERNWMAISAELFAPQPSRVERWLRRLSVPPSVTRLMVATPALRRAWFLALALVVFIGLAAADRSQTREDLLTLLVLAPLVPVLGVSMAYGTGSDPAHEISLATPLSGFRLVMIRSATVVACSVVVLAAASLLTGAVSTMTFGWLLPSLGLTAGSLALMTFTTPRRAGAIAAIGWVAAVIVARNTSGDPLAAFTATGQVAMALATGIGLVTAYHRRDRFDLLAEST